MKIRTGFVSNSSSSSFLIERKYITDEQWDLIINRKEKFRDVFMKFVVYEAYDDDILIEKFSNDNYYEFRELLFYLIKHLEEGKKEDEFFKDIEYNCWNIVEKKDDYDKWFERYFKSDDPEDTVLFETIITNFDMQMYLQMIGVDITKIFREGE